MKVLFGVIGLLLALAIVASVAKKQLQAVGAVPGLTAASSAASPAGEPPSTVRDQSQALQQQIKQDVERAMQAAPARNDAAER